MAEESQELVPRIKPGRWWMDTGRVGRPREHFWRTGGPLEVAASPQTLGLPVLGGLGGLRRLMLGDQAVE